MNRHISAHIVLIISATLFTAVAYLVHFTPDESFKTLTGVSSFLFGIFIAFGISNSSARFNKIIEKLETEEALLLYIYNVSTILGHDTQAEIRKRIDAYLTSQIDYYLHDYKKTSPQFLQLFTFLLTGIKPGRENKSQEYVHEDIMETLKTLAENRKQIEVAIQNSMTRLEWVCICALLSILLFAIFCMNNGTPISIIVSVLIATTAVVFVTILKELNELKWKDNQWVWDDLTGLFKELDLIPYYPEEIIKYGKINIKHVGKARIASYPDPYPDFTNKKITIIEG